MEPKYAFDYNMWSIKTYLQENGSKGVNRRNIVLSRTREVTVTT